MVLILDTKTFDAMRIRQGHSINSLAKKAGISHTYLAQVSTGRKNPSPRIAKAIADALGARFDDLWLINYRR